MRITYIIIIAVLAFYANGLRLDNLEKDKQVNEYKKYKCAWEDFNRSFIPETALPRIKEIEAIYAEEKRV